MYCLLVQSLAVIVGVAFYTLLERKILAYLQTRKGPNKPGPLGLLVPFGDAIKLATKESNTPSRGNKIFFTVIPGLALLIPLILWSAYPTLYDSLTLNHSVLWFICISSIGVYAILGAGWRRNSKYSFLGAVRSVAQSVSYEVSLTIIIVHRVLMFYYMLIQSKLSVIRTFLFSVMLLLVVSSLAETNRSPFDFAEGESELVSGFNTEYRSVPFLIIFLAEYMSILFLSTMVSLLFNMREYMDIFLFLILWAVFFIWSRGTLPRLRYDQLIHLAWKNFLPLVLSTLALLLVL